MIGYQAQNNKLSNWFSRIIERKGADCIKSGRLTTDEVSRNAEKIIDDILRCRIDYEKYGSYIIAPVVLEPLIGYCTNKLAIDEAILFSLGYTHNDYVNGCIFHGTGTFSRNQYFDNGRRVAAILDDNLANNIAQALAIKSKEVEIYTIILQALQSIRVTKNPYELYALTSRLNMYTRSMPKY